MAFQKRPIDTSSVDPSTSLNVPDVLIIFKPWEDAKKDFEENGIVKLNHIKEPPCKHCESFRPRVVTTNQGDYNGVVLCSRERMERDFSCFQQRGLQVKEHERTVINASEL